MKLLLFARPLLLLMSGLLILCSILTWESNPRSAVLFTVAALVGAGGYWLLTQIKRIERGRL